MSGQKKNASVPSCSAGTEAKRFCGATRLDTESVPTLRVQPYAGPCNGGPLRLAYSPSARPRKAIHTPLTVPPFHHRRLSEPLPRELLTPLHRFNWVYFTTLPPGCQALFSGNFSSPQVGRPRFPSLPPPLPDRENCVRGSRRASQKQKDPLPAAGDLLFSRDSLNQ